MEDKRTAFAILICIFLFMFWFELVMAPYRPAPAASPPLQNAQGIEQGTQRTTPAPSTIAPATSAAATGSSGGGSASQLFNDTPSNPNAAQLAAGGTTVVTADNLEIHVAHLGGRLAHYRLIDYKRIRGVDEPLDMVAAADGSPLPLGLYRESWSDALVPYAVREIAVQRGDTVNVIPPQGTIRVAGGESVTLTLEHESAGAAGAAQRIRKVLRFRPSNYDFDVEATFENAPSSKQIWLEWSRTLSELELHQRLNPEQISLLGESNKVIQLPLTDVQEGLKDVGNNFWVSLGDQYFMASLMPNNAGAATGPTRIGRLGSVFRLQIGSAIGSAPGQTAGAPSAARDSAAFKSLAFVGPKYHSELLKLGHQLERNVDLGWFSFVAHPLLGLIKVFYRLLGNYGLAIILLTLIIKLAFLPLTKASFKSMSAMQEVQPEMKALRERIQDPQQLNKEIMALYKKRGVNPMGGCLPMLIQLPVFLGLYNALLHSVELRHAPFALWITDLSAPERLEVFGVGIPVMVLLMGASMFLQQLTTPSTGDATQRRMMMLMPVILTVSFVIFPFPSGLVLYWLVNNLISIIQQMYLRSEKLTNPLKATVIASIVLFCVGYFLTLL